MGPKWNQGVGRGWGSHSARICRNKKPRDTQNGGEKRIRGSVDATSEAMGMQQGIDAVSIHRRMAVSRGSERRWFGRYWVYFVSLCLFWGV